jgi:hypothetical protein
MGLQPAEPGRSGGGPVMTGRKQIISGITRLARFDARGMACFPGTKDGFLASLAPWVAITLVGAALSWLHDGAIVAARELLLAAVLLLAPPVITHVFAQMWQRGANWLRYSTAFNWCQWALPVAASIWLILVRGSMAAGLPDPIAGVIAVGGVLSYALALHWFVVRHGLGVSVWRSLAVVVLTNMGTALLVLLPRLAVVLSGLEPT